MGRFHLFDESSSKGEEELVQTLELTIFGTLVPMWRTHRRRKIAAKLPAKAWAAEKHAAIAANRATQLRRLVVRGKQGDQSAKQMN